MRNPRFVGEIRGATFLSSSCTLSWIKQLCCSVLYSAQSRQKWSAAVRNSHRLLADACRRGARGGRLSHSEIGLLNAHNKRIGSAAAKALRLLIHTNPNSPNATTGVQFR